MKNDYLIINHFRLREIIADENIGNTLCGFIPCDGDYVYVNLFTESFEQLYSLLQISKQITESILLEMADRMSSGEERPIIIEARSLNQCDFIELDFGFCLRNCDTVEETEQSNVKSYLIDKFFQFQDIEFVYASWSENYEDEVFDFSMRFHLYKTLKANGVNEMDSRSYSDLQDDIVFSFCNKLYKEILPERKAKAPTIDYSKLKVACANVEANQLTDKEQFSVLLIVNGYEKQLSCNALRVDFYQQNIKFNKLEWLQRYFKFGNWYDCSTQTQNDVVNKLKQLQVDKLQPVVNLLNKPIEDI
jgi:hypothetical protein